MNRGLFLVVGLLVGSALLACERTKSEERPASRVAEMTDEVLDRTKIPVKEDFEEKARNVVDEVNLDDELNQLEQDIAADESKGS